MREQSRITKISIDRLRSGDLTAAEFEQLFRVTQEMDKLPLHIDDDDSQSIESMFGRARELQRTRGLHLAIIDYLQLVDAPYDRPVERVSHVSRQIKRLIAGQLGVPVISLSQLSRPPERTHAKRPPQLSDLRESGAIEQDSDVVLFIHRPSYYLEREQPQKSDFRSGDDYATALGKWDGELKRSRGSAEVHVAKFRFGKLRVVRLGYNEDTGAFSDEPEVDDAQQPDLLGEPNF